MDPLWSETCWSTFKYFIILFVSTYYISCISLAIKCLTIIDAPCKHEDSLCNISLLYLQTILGRYGIRVDAVIFVSTNDRSRNKLWTNPLIVTKPYTTHRAVTSRPGLSTKTYQRFDSAVSCYENHNIAVGSHSPPQEEKATQGQKSAHYCTNKPTTASQRN